MEERAERGMVGGVVGSDWILVSNGPTEVFSFWSPIKPIFILLNLYMANFPGKIK